MTDKRRSAEQAHSHPGSSGALERKDILLRGIDAQPLPPLLRRVSTRKAYDATFASDSEAKERMVSGPKEIEVAASRLLKGMGLTSKYYEDGFGLSYDAESDRLILHMPLEVGEGTKKRGSDTIRDMLMHSRNEILASRRKYGVLNIIAGSGHGFDINTTDGDEQGITIFLPVSSSEDRARQAYM